MAYVKNQGTGASASDTPIKTLFSVNGKEIAFSTNYTQSIPAGGMGFIEADGGQGSTNLWNADSLGTYSVSAVVDPDNVIGECVENNNASSTSLTVYPPPLVNIALNKTVTVSSIEKTGLEGKNAVDGNFSTRWSSAFSDPQYISVDLGAIQSLKDIMLYWETAFGKSYQVQLSDDNVTYKTIFTESNGDGGIDKIVTSEQCRYVKIVCLQRGTEWGYSLFEIVVHDTTPAQVGTETPPIPHEYALFQNYPNPFNPSTTIKYQLPMNNHVTLKVYDLLGKEIATLVNEQKNAGTYSIQFSVKGEFGSGIYFYTLRAGNFTATKKLLLLK